MAQQGFPASLVSETGNIVDYSRNILFGNIQHKVDAPVISNEDRFLFVLPVHQYSTIRVTLSGTYTGQAIAWEGYTGSEWVDVQGIDTKPSNGIPVVPDAASGSGQTRVFPMQGLVMFRGRVRLLATGTIFATVSASIDPILIGAVYSTSAGTAAHSATRVGNPVVAASRSITAFPTDLVNNDTADLLSSGAGQLVTIPYSIPEANVFSNNTITTNGTISLAPGVAGLRNYLVAIHLKNTSAVASEFEIRDGATTVLYKGHLSASMATTEKFSFDLPLRSSVNTALNIVILTTGTNTYVSSQAYKAI